LQSFIDNLVLDIEAQQTPETSAQNNPTVELDLCFGGSFVMSQSSQTIPEENEIQKYLNSNDLFISKSIMKFWSENKEKYPKLYVIAKRLSSIPATNLSSERNFNYSNQTLNDQRSCIEPNNVNKLLFIRSNFDLYKTN